MAPSLIYKSTLLYEAAMLALYGRHYFARYRAIADLIPPGASILDLCCGPAVLYHRYLRHKRVAYTGLDINRKFAARLNARGARGRVWDVGQEAPLPAADYVVMQASLYHFLPDAKRVVDLMLRAARRQAIVAEPVHNFASSQLPLLAWLGRRFTDPGVGEQAARFTEQSLDRLFAAYQTRVSAAFLIPGGREKIYVINSASAV